MLIYFKMCAEQLIDFKQFLYFVATPRITHIYIYSVCKCVNNYLDYVERILLSRIIIIDSTICNVGWGSI